MTRDVCRRIFAATASPGPRTRRSKNLISQLRLEPLAHRHYDTFELPKAAGRLLPDRLAIPFPPTAKETLQVWPLRSSASLKTSF
jgi:hypothetical protein